MNVHAVFICVLICVLGVLGVQSCKLMALSTQLSTPITHNKAEEAKNSPDIINSIKWEVNDEVRVEASVEEITNKEGQKSTRLLIKNISLNEILFQTDDVGFVSSMYANDVNGDGIPELILTTTYGVGGSTLRIYSVHPKQVSLLFKEFYRIDASVIHLSDPSSGVMDILLTTGETANGPFYTSRYIWNNNHFLMVGKVPYRKLQITVEDVFRVRGKVVSSH